MLNKYFSKKKLLVTLLFVFTIFALSLFADESLGRFLTLSVLVLIFYFSYFFTNKIPLSFLLFIILSLPLNITYQQPIEFSNTLVNNIHVNYLVPTLSVIDLGVFLFLFASLIENNFVFKKIYIKYKQPLLLFLVFLLAQNIFFRDILVSLNSVRFFAYILAFLILVEEFQKNGIKRKEITIVSLFLLISTVLQAMIGYIQFEKGVSLGLNFFGESKVAAGLLGSSFVSLSGNEILRSYGTFPHPNMLAGFFLLSFFFSLYLLKNIEKKFSFLPYITILTSIIFIIPTFSRVTILVLFLCILVLGITFLFKRKVFFSFTPVLLIERFFSLFEGGDLGAIDRVNLIKVFPSVFKENIFQGTGLGRFVLFMGDRAPVTKGGLFLLQPVHNVVLLLLSELGIFGFSSFCFLFYTIIKKNIKSLTLVSVLILFSLFVISMFDHYLVSLPQGIAMFWCFIGLTILFSNKLKKVSSR